MSFRFPSFRFTNRNDAYSSVAATVPLVGLRLFGRVAEFTGWAVLARQLGASDFGGLSIAFLICRYLGIIADWGAAARGSRDVVSYGDKGIYALIQQRRINTILSAAAFILGCVLFHKPQFVPLVFTILNQGLGRDWIAVGLQRSRRAALPTVVQGLLLFALSFTAHTAFAGALVVAVAYGVAFLISISANPARSVPSDAMAMPDAWMMAGAFFDQVTVSVDTILLGVLISTQEAGIYAAVYRIPNMLISVIQLFIAAIVPYLTQIYKRDKGEFQSLFRQLSKLGVSLSIFAVIGIPIVYLMVPVLFGDQYESGRLAGAILMASVAMWSLVGPVLPLFLAIEKERVASVAVIVAAVFNIVANLVVIPIFGMTGAAVATLLTQTIVTSSLFYYCWSFSRKDPLGST